MDIPEQINSNEMEALKMASQKMREDLKNLEKSFEEGNCRKADELTEELDKRFGELRMTFIQKVQQFNKKEGRKQTNTF